MRASVSPLVGCGLLLFVFIVLSNFNFGHSKALKNPPIFEEHDGWVRGSLSEVSTESRSAGEEEDEDSDEDEGRDAVDEERKTGVVVAAVPVVLGLVTVVLLCVVMICRRTYRHKSKWPSSRQPRICTNENEESCRDSVDSEFTNNMSYVETYQVEETTNQVQEVIPPPVYPSPFLSPEEDLPPSYEEVMNSELYRINNNNHQDSTCLSINQYHHQTRQPENR